MLAGACSLLGTPGENLLSWFFQLLEPPTFLGLWHLSSIFKARNIAPLWPFFSSHVSLSLTTFKTGFPVLRTHRLDWVHLDIQGTLPISNFLTFIISARSLLPWKVTYLFIGSRIKTWTYLGSHCSATTLIHSKKIMYSYLSQHPGYKQESSESASIHQEIHDLRLMFC